MCFLQIWDLSYSLEIVGRGRILFFLSSSYKPLHDLVSTCPSDPWPQTHHTAHLSIHFESEVKVLVTQSCPTLCDPMDCSPPGSYVYRILQTRILEWVAISFSRGSSWPRDRTQVSHTAGRLFTNWATRQTQYSLDLGCSKCESHFKFSSNPLNLTKNEKLGSSFALVTF